MGKKRYQECNKLEKFWRRRWYLTIPFLQFWYTYFSHKKVYLDKVEDGKIIPTKEFEVLKGERLKSVLRGEMQGSDKMNYIWTSEELEEIFKSKGYGKSK